MAYECPHCHAGETLSNRSVTVQQCIKCGKIIGSEKLVNKLRDLGVKEDTIKKINRDLAVNEL